MTPVLLRAAASQLLTCKQNREYQEEVAKRILKTQGHYWKSSIASFYTFTLATCIWIVDKSHTRLFRKPQDESPIWLAEQT
jgi:hypothetical protein